MKAQHYSLMDQLMASPTEPLLESKRGTYINKARVSCLVMAGANPAYEAADICVDIISMVQSLVDMGVLEDTSDLLRDAKAAIGCCVQHYPGPALSLSQAGAIAMSSVIEDYAEAMAQVPARVMIACHRRAQKERSSLPKSALRQVAA
jgi:hypothetical protein